MVAWGNEDFIWCKQERKTYEHSKLGKKLHKMANDIDDAQAELDSVEAELEVVELQISELLEKQAKLNSRKNKLLKNLEGACSSAQPSGSSKAPKTSSPSFSKQDIQHYEESDFSWSKEVQEKLVSVFKLSKFRSLQRAAINLSMSGKDLFLVMPTGRGKSLCYQLPALCSNGFTLVITPLLSLMEDQLMYLQSINVSAVTLNASSTKEDSKWILAGMMDKNSPFKLLYVTPEKIAKSKMIMSKLEKAYNMGLLARIAVDEVHCCSQWGHDFRPDYKLLGILKRQFPKVPLVGLTATAASNVLKDCQKILFVQEPITLTAPFNRVNLYYEVRFKDNEDCTDEIAALIRGRYKNQSGIVYVFSQKDAEVVATDLQMRDIIAQPYHANMQPADKSRVHQRWSSKKIQVVVATVAFGMGIDKADVRFVIHHTISKSIENYYQESGRAGRDDGPADCIVFYGFSDIFRISTMVVMENTGQQKLHNMVAYCQNVDRCRRALMAIHFDEVWNDDECNQMCDVCRHGNDYITMDITKHAREVVEIVELARSMDEKLTPLKVCEAWMGKGPAKHRKMTKITSLSRLEVESIIIHLLLHGYLSEDFSFTPYTTHFYLKLGRKAALLKNDSHSITMKMKRRVPSHSTDVHLEGESLEEVETALTEVATTAIERHKTKIHKNHQNMEESLVPSQIDNLASEVSEYVKQTSVFDVDVVVNVIEQNRVTEEEETSKGLQNTPKQQSTSMKSRQKPLTQQSNCTANAEQPKPNLVSTPSEISIISAAAVEELHHLRSYYSKQLRRINYISHEHLQSSQPGMLTCMTEPFKSLRFPSRTTIARGARNLWTRVSMRRKLIQ
ncbi:ATP-dependent DNA helicase Q1-like isoform X2 [Myxocyprinus asiaticus]|uniref:ATP-dependent DNA helicase Q1-like isoform X2 n=1 Tax=Myxocyprinus asiaticus TaxID=70543 RepID=UPI0022216F81|nr:ATP-dependent DNA helicase Q1-like isoform X2 [Myxocyprinus asiaticus]